ncbi:MAG: hypothetical protein ACLFP4_07495 [Spirochaetales bacterium]
MVARRIGFLLAGLWTLVRFVTVYLLLASSLPQGPLVHVNLLWFANGGLIATALFAASAALPDAAPRYLPLMRIVALLFVLSDAAVILSGSIMPPDSGVAAAQGTFLISFGILVLDLAMLAGLLSHRFMDKNGERSENKEDESRSFPEQ